MGSILRAIRYILNIQIKIGSQARNIYYTSDFKLIGSQNYLDEIETLTIYNKPNERGLLKLNEHLEILTDIISMGSKVLLLSDSENDTYDINIHLIHRYRYPFSIFYISKYINSDYQYIYYKKSNDDLICDELSETINDKETLLTGDIKEINNKRMIDICQEFYSFLKNSAHSISPLNQDNGIRSKELFPMSLIAKIHELCNDFQFELISEIDMFNAFNNPKEFGFKLKCKDNQMNRVYFLIRNLSNFISQKYGTEKKKEWRDSILSSLNIKLSIYNSKSKYVSTLEASSADEKFYRNINRIFNSESDSDFYIEH
ncbi:MAG: hypothetical protein ACK5MK_14870 [Dysgonomonas sp.]